MCGELVTQADAGGKRTGPGAGREAQVPLSRLHLLLGTLRTRPAGEAPTQQLRVPSASALSIHLGGQGMWVGGCLGGRGLGGKS